MKTRGKNQLNLTGSGWITWQKLWRQQFLFGVTTQDSGLQDTCLPNVQTIHTSWPTWSVYAEVSRSVSDRAAVDPEILQLLQADHQDTVHPQLIHGWRPVADGEKRFNMCQLMPSPFQRAKDVITMRSCATGVCGCRAAGRLSSSAAWRRTAPPSDPRGAERCSSGWRWRPRPSTAFAHLRRAQTAALRSIGTLCARKRDSGQWERRDEFRSVHAKTSDHPAGVPLASGLYETFHHLSLTL